MENIIVTALILVSVAFFISFCFNVFLCIRRRAILCRCKDDCGCSHNSDRDSLSPMETGYFHQRSHHEQQENPHNHHEQQENPIYGNISAARRDSAEDCYEMMTLQRTRNCRKPLEPDLNYASLDLKKAKKRKKNRHLRGQLQGRNQLQDQDQDHAAPPANAFLEVDADADADAHLPPRDTGTMVSHSSIYLNSLQIAQETEEMERERSASVEENLGWDGVHGFEELGGGRWGGDGEREGRKDELGGSNGNVCVLRSE